MKYIFSIQHEIEFKFSSKVNKDELLKEFCECIYETDMEGLNHFVAERLTLGDRNFIEGIGPVFMAWWNLEDAPPASVDEKDYVVFYKCDMTDFEVLDIIE